MHMTWTDFFCTTWGYVRVKSNSVLTKLLKKNLFSMLADVRWSPYTVEIGRHSGNSSWSAAFQLGVFRSNSIAE